MIKVSVIYKDKVTAYVEHTYDENSICIGSKIFNANGEITLQSQGFIEVFSAIRMGPSIENAFFVQGFDQTEVLYATLSLENCSLQWMRNTVKTQNGEQIVITTEYDEEGQIKNEKATPYMFKLKSNERFLSDCKIDFFEFISNGTSATGACIVYINNLTYYLAYHQDKVEEGFDEIQIYDSDKNLIFESEKAKWNARSNLIVTDYSDNSTDGSRFTFHFDENGKFVYEQTEI